MVSAKVLSIYCLLLCGSTEKSFSQNKPLKEDIEQLTKLEYDWIMAEFRLDSMTLFSILDETFIAIDSAGISNKQQEMRGVYEHVMQMRKSEHIVDSLYLDDVHIQTYNNTAVVTFIAVTKGKIRNRPFQNRKTRFYDVWIKQGEHWKAVSSQVTRLY